MYVILSAGILLKVYYRMKETGLLADFAVLISEGWQAKE